MRIKPNDTGIFFPFQTYIYFKRFSLFLGVVLVTNAQIKQWIVRQANVSSMVNEHWWKDSLFCHHLLFHLLLLFFLLFPLPWFDVCIDHLTGIYNFQPLHSSLSFPLLSMLLSQLETTIKSAASILLCYNGNPKCHQFALLVVTIIEQGQSYK